MSSFGDYLPNNIAKGLQATDSQIFFHTLGVVKHTENPKLSIRKMHPFTILLYLTPGVSNLSLRARTQLSEKVYVAYI